MDEIRMPAIGEFDHRSRWSPKALRLYERQVLPPPASNGHRRYREDRLGDARPVARLRRPDMPLAEAARILAAPANGRAGSATSLPGQVTIDPVK